MIKKALLFILLFAFCVFAFLIATVPAGIVWKHILIPYTPVSSIGLQAKAFSGTMWEGRAHISFRHIEGVLSWDIDTLGFVRATVPIGLQLDSTAGELEADFLASLTEQRLNIDNVNLELEALNPFMRVHRVTLDGEFVAKGIELTARDQKLIAAKGVFSWDGGNVTYPAGRSMHERSLPRFRGQLKNQGNGQIVLGIRDANANFDMMRGTLDPNGDALWEVSRRVLDIANEPWSANSSETDVVFKVKKNIYEG